MRKRLQLFHNKPLDLHRIQNQFFTFSKLKAMTQNPNQGLVIKDPQNDALFSHLQGNILKGHGREHTAHVFVKFYNPKKKAVKKWLKCFAEENLTSCKKQLKENELYKRNGVKGGLFTGIYLTKSGISYLKGEKPLVNLTDEAFLAGMKSRKEKLNDPDSSKWDTGLREEFDAMFLLAYHDKTQLALSLNEVLAQLHGKKNALARICHVEFGNAIHNENGDGIEHFGYVDGISQPLFFQDEIANFCTTSGIDSIEKAAFNPLADKFLVLVKDPFVEDKDAYGSYFVFRKLEQNVRAFKKEEKEKADKLGLKGDDDERMGAMIVGRFEDGTPVTLSKEEGLIGSGNSNNFNYEADKEGAKCPFHAHIRKTNPRDATIHPHIMARRGIPYGIRNVSPDLKPHESVMPTEGVGLLFMSFQSNLVNQFEHIQSLANAKGLDAIIGQVAEGEAKKSVGEYTKVYGDASKKHPIDFNLHVKMKGGEYFFAPSLAFFESLTK